MLRSVGSGVGVTVLAAVPVGDGTTTDVETAVDGLTSSIAV